MFIMHYLTPDPIDLSDIARVARPSGLATLMHESGPFRSLKITFATGLSWYWEPVPKEYWIAGELSEDALAFVAAEPPARIFSVRMNPVPTSELSRLLGDLLARHAGVFAVEDSGRFGRERLADLVAYVQQYDARRE